MKGVDEAHELDVAKHAVHADCLDKLWKVELGARVLVEKLEDLVAQRATLLVKVVEELVNVNRASAVCVHLLKAHDELLEVFSVESQKVDCGLHLSRRLLAGAEVVWDGREVGKVLGVVKGLYASL